MNDAIEYTEITVEMDLGSPFSDGTKIAPGAMDVSKFLENPVVLMNFDPSRPPVGKILSMEKLEGDKYRFRMKIEKRLADPLRDSMIEASPGFIVRQWEETEEGQRTLKQGELVSISFSAKTRES